MMNHCDCDACKRDRELMEMVREFLPLLVILARAQASASINISHKWRDLDGEGMFKKLNEMRKGDIMQTERMAVNV